MDIGIIYQPGKFHGDILIITKVMRDLLPRTHGPKARQYDGSRGESRLLTAGSFGRHAPPSRAGVRGNKTTVKFFPSLCFIRILQGVYIPRSSTIRDNFKTLPEVYWFYLIISKTMRLIVIILAESLDIDIIYHTSKFHGDISITPQYISYLIL